MENKKIVPDKTRKKPTYYDKYLALQNDFLEIAQLEIIEGLSYNKARLQMNELIEKIIIHNEKEPLNKWRYSDTRPKKVPKAFVIQEFKINENYIFKKAKEELQLKSLLNEKGE